MVATFRSLTNNHDTLTWSVSKLIGSLWMWLKVG